MPHLPRNHVRPSHPLLWPHIRPLFHPTLARLRSPHLPHHPTSSSSAPFSHPQPRPSLPYLQFHPCFFPQITTFPFSRLLPLLSLFPFPLPRLDALRHLHSLSKHNPSFRREITESGAISAVLRCLSAASASREKAVQEAALAVLFDLSLDDDNKVGIVAEGGVTHIVAALRDGMPNCRALAATTLTSLAVVEVNKGTIGDDPFAVRALVALLRDGKGRGKREAATALYTLCSFPENKRRAVEAGAVPVLLELADSGVERAVEVLGLLGKCREGREEMGRLDGCVSVLVRVLKKGRSRSVEHALSALNVVCGHCQRMAFEAKSEGVLEQCFELVGDENLKIGRNASSLIKTLHRCGPVG